MAELIVKIWDRLINGTDKYVINKPSPKPPTS